MVHYQRLEYRASSCDILVTEIKCTRKWNSLW